MEVVYKPDFGLHNLGQDKKGLILVVYDGEEIEEFVEELNLINDVNVNYMETSI